MRVELELDPALAMGPRVTAVIPVRRPGPERRYVAAGASFERLLGAAYWRRPYFYWSDGSYDGPTILGRAVKIDDAPATAARRPSPPTDEDRLAAAIEARAYAAAADLILESAGPFEPEVGSWRTLVACLEAAGRTGEAARVFVERLEKARDARELAELLALSREGVLPPDDRQRANRLAAEYAERTGDPRGLVLLASHVLESKRGESAARLVEEARQAGLDTALAERLVRVMDPPEAEPGG